jgi:hypothetical protein
MTEKLAGLVIPVLEPLGYQQGWGMATVARIRQEIPDDVGRLTLRQQNIDEVMSCGGLWQGREMDLPVTAFDGTPDIHMVIDGQRMWQPLERVQTKRRGTTLYGHWRIPDHDAVSPHLRGMTAWIRQSSTDDERANGKRRTRALRTIPPTDPDWRRLFGGREDTESMHNHTKEKWFGRRVRAVGLERRELQLPGYQIHQGITALLAWHYRTGGDVSRYFGTWDPSNRNPKSRA